MTYVSMHQRSEIRKRKRRIAAFTVLFLAVFGLAIYLFVIYRPFRNTSYGKIPAYSGDPYSIVNNNKPFFSENDYSLSTFESYSELDHLGRCGVVYANITRDLMPTEPREDIGSIIPSGWIQETYEGVVDAKPPYLYNRCHLIAHCLTAENDNERNLITGTVYMNIKGMLPFEEKVAKYLDTCDNHVMYRVTPVFTGNNLLADGVLMEAYSVEDRGDGICFCVYCYNVQPGVRIDYSTGKSFLQ